MVTVTRKQGTTKGSAPVIRSYNEIVEYLDSHWSKSPNTDLQQIKALDKALGNPSKAVSVIAVGGTNGKGLTINFSAALLRQEGLKVGAFYCPRVLTYNEQFSVNGETIANKIFTDIANDIINTAATHDITVSSHDILIMCALVYFKQQKVDVALVELYYGARDPLTICPLKVLAITRVTDDIFPNPEQAPDTIIKNLIGTISKETLVVSGDQSKAHLQLMQDETKKVGATWSMPIRKLAELTYPFEQLHGRCAALAERIGQVYVEKFVSPSTLVMENSLLAKQKGQRGRPTLEAKRNAELNPKKTIEQFWQETVANVPARFEVLDKEKPSVLLDPAPNVDALKNLLLGVRLLHYQRPLKGLTFIFACDKNKMHIEMFLRELRYFSKKNSANIIFCPISKPIAGITEHSWNIDEVTNDMKSWKLKARVAAHFDEAFEIAKTLVDERNGLVVITGSHAIVAEYWHHKGIKKLQQQ